MKAVRVKNPIAMSTSDDDGEAAVAEDDESQCEYELNEDQSEGQYCSDEEWKPRSELWRARVLRMTDAKCCKDACVRGMEAAVERFLVSKDTMSKSEVKASLLSVLGVCLHIESGKQN